MVRVMLPVLHVQVSSFPHEFLELNYAITNKFLLFSLYLS